MLRLLCLWAVLAAGVGLQLQAPRVAKTSFALRAKPDPNPDPFNMETPAQVPQQPLAPSNHPNSFVFVSRLPTLLLILLPMAAMFMSSEALAATDLQQLFDPSQFQPVCPASDTVYQLLKVTANGVVGKDNVDEYGPLIASVLLRIRLELCVLESFLYEAVIPFVSKKGLSWVLPLHETVESFLAGTIFAIASNFILLGSTKILSVLFIYADVITGMPTRFLGNTLRKTNPPNSPLDRVGYVVKLYGDVIGTVKSVLESADTFVGRYLVIFTTLYIAFKFLHFKVFNDIFP